MRLTHKICLFQFQNVRHPSRGKQPGEATLVTLVPRKLSVSTSVFGMARPRRCVAPQRVDLRLLIAGEIFSKLISLIFAPSKM
jgi:hypothetical protein